MAAYLPRIELQKIFGSILFEDVSLLPLFREVRTAHPVNQLDLFFSVVGLKPIFADSRGEAKASSSLET